MNHQGLRQQLQQASKAERVRLLLAYLTAHGSACYEEEVTQLQHALQTAHLAAEANQGQALIAAALLHDIGHILADDPEQANDPTVQNDLHEEVAADYLAEFFPQSVTEPIRLHVPAKRYLCTKQLGYYEQLSEASQKSYYLQGGPMSTAELAQFEAQPFCREAVWLRGWDDAAKDVSRQVPPIAAYEQAVEAALL